MTETKIDDTAPEAVYFPWDPECLGSILNQPVNPDELIVSYSLYVEFYCRATTEMAVHLARALDVKLSTIKYHAAEKPPTSGPWSPWSSQRPPSCTRTPSRPFRDQKWGA